MTTSDIQIWVGIAGSLVTISVSVLGILNFQLRRDRSAAVGAAFKDVVDSLASHNPTLRMAAAILLRRFFDSRSEQGAAHRSYAEEAKLSLRGYCANPEQGQSRRHSPMVCGMRLLSRKLISKAVTSQRRTLGRRRETRRLLTSLTRISSKRI